MKKPIHDERIIQETLRQNNRGFTILYLGVLLDLLYRQFILQESLSRYWDVALLFFGVSFYLAISRVRSGLFANRPSLKPLILSSVVATVVILSVNFFWLGNSDFLELIIGGATFWVTFCAINLIMQYISSKKNDELLK